jgi:light-regulated signal transduction histidine kinase (bacteriophytochrome)
MTEFGKVDLTNCDREPIHIPGSIQPHGVMLVCDAQLQTVAYASQNASAMLGRFVAAGGDATLGEVLGDEVAHDLRNAMVKAGAQAKAGIVLGLRFPGADTAFDATVHAYQDRAFVELEPCSDDGVSARNALDVIQSLISRVGLETTIESIAKAGSRLVRSLLGYDRVMVYRFLHNGAGRVIAEARGRGQQSFLGQHFPASDIPVQARRLYVANTVRLISDAAYAPIPLEPPLAARDSPVDMSFAQLRSVSPIHCEYLQNMGVAASLSISIVVDGELWGLIACHHNSPKVAPIPLRVGAELFGHYFSMQISLAERRAEILAAAEAREGLDAIVSDLSAEGSMFEGVAERLPAFRKLMPCDGVGLWANASWRTDGDALDPSAARSLVAAIGEGRPGALWQSQSLRDDLPDVAAGPVAGVLAVPLSFLQTDYLLYFRNEEPHDIEWAGEPVKIVTPTATGDRLTPRGSFETWRQEVAGRSTPWTDADRTVAEAIRTYLRDVLMRQTELTAEERARTDQRRRMLNDELNHRVKNIITLVKSIALQTGVRAENVTDYTAALEGRLNALAFAHDQSLRNTGAGGLETLFEAEASLHRFGAEADRVTISGPPLRLSDRTFGALALVVHELMTNAAKYGALSRPKGRLDVRWALNAAGECEIAWTETGGPSVRPPTREGFGTKLIRSTVEYDLQGVVEIDYDPGGLLARFVIPAEHVSVAEEAARATPDAPAVEAALTGQRILVLEDQSLIAMDAEETLRRLGVEEIYLSPTVADAEAVLHSQSLDAALLDFNLGSTTSLPIADALTERGIPFVFATGYGDGVMIPERFRDVPVVRKPVTEATLARQLTLAKEAASAKARGG